MSWTIIATVALASFVIIIVPGPTVTVIIANSLRDGARAGLLNVAGTQAGLVPMLFIVALGLETVVSFMAHAFVWVKLAGAAYLIYLGYRLLRGTGDIGDVSKVRKPKIGYFWQGFIVIWSNPKALLFFGAFIPQFVDPAAGNTFEQTLILGLVFMAVGAIFDSMYALIAGKAGSMLTRTRVKLVERISGTILIGGGLWLATLKRA
ncbi:MAG: LysE family translocator [Salaquimonas sp.]|jgi:threonine/homoserine/homoserine lactone efflux protein|nr:LysE family translocator [Salaquimonas sp.]